MDRFAERLLALAILSITLSALYYFYVQNRAVVEVHLVADTQTTLKIYWAGSKTHFHEHRSSKAYLHPDKLIYRLRIGSLPDIERLRIDTSDVPHAVVRINSIEIRQTGYEPLVYKTVDDFRQIRPQAGIKRFTVDDGGMLIVPETDDPQLILAIPYLASVPLLPETILPYTVIFILVGIGLLLFNLRVEPYEYIPCLSLFVCALIIVMAVASGNNRHPDEYVHVAAAAYYSDHWLPPEIGSPGITTSYSAYGFSRLHTGELVYLIAGKFQKLLAPFELGMYLSARIFNVLLFFSLCLMAFKKVDFRLFMLPVLLTPQIWYVFSYFNSDAFALFVSMLAGYQLTNHESLFHSCLDSESRLGRWWAYGVSGVLLGCLLLIKKNFYFFDLFLLLYFAWALFFNRIHLRRDGFLRIGLVMLIGFGIYGGYWVADLTINDFHRSEKLLMAEERFALEEYKPSTPLAAKHPSLLMRERGKTLSSLLNEKELMQRILRSSFGQYSYASINGSNLYYELVRLNITALLVLFLLSVIRRGDLAAITLTGVFVSVFAALLAAVIYHCWSLDFKPQGRYLLPVIAMIGMVLQHTYRFQPRFLLNPLFFSIFLLSMYNFIFIGIYEIDKYGW